MALIDDINSVWRDYVVSGDPGSGANEPNKAQIRLLLQKVDTQLRALGSASGTISVVYETRAELYADLTPGAGAAGWVIGDPAEGYDGVYQKSGATGTGSWVQIAPLADVIQASLDSAAAAAAAAGSADYAAAAVAAGLAAQVGGRELLLPVAPNGLEIVFIIQDQVNNRTAAYITDDGSLFVLGTLNAPAIEIDGSPLDLSYVPSSSPMISINGILASEYSMDPVSGNIVSFRAFSTGRRYEWISGAFRAVAADVTPPVLTRNNDATFSSSSGSTLAPIWGAHVRDDASSVDVYCRLGQSWDQGNNSAAGGSAEANTFTPTALNTGVALMLAGSGGINPRGSFSTALVDLQEGTNTTNSQESGWARFADAMIDAVTSVLGSSRKIVCTSSAIGGQPIESYQPGGVIYQRLLDQIEAIQAACLAAYSERAIVRAVFTRSPQANSFSTPRSELARAYASLLQNISADLKRLTGQSEDIRGFISQMSSASSAASEQDAALFALDLHRLGVGWTCCGPMYWCEADGTGTGATGGHLSTFGFACMGLLEQEAAWQQMHRKGFMPVMLLPSKTRWISTGASPVVEVAFSRAIVEDTSGVWVSTSGLSNKGIEIVDDVGASTLSSVSVLASVGTAAIVGNAITLSDGAGAASSDNVGSKLGSGPWAVWCTVGGITYGVEGTDSNVTFGAVAAALGALIPGATVLNNVVTCGSAPSAAAWATNKLRVTISTKPGAGRWKFLVAGKWQGSGAGVGPVTGARSLFRNAVPFNSIIDPSAVSRQLFHWACHDSIDLPRY